MRELHGQTWCLQDPFEESIACVGKCVKVRMPTPSESNRQKRILLVLRCLVYHDSIFHPLCLSFFSKESLPTFTINKNQLCLT